MTVFINICPMTAGLRASSVWIKIGMPTFVWNTQIDLPGTAAVCMNNILMVGVSGIWQMRHFERVTLVYNCASSNRACYGGWSPCNPVRQGHAPDFWAIELTIPHSCMTGMVSAETKTCEGVKK